MPRYRVEYTYKSLITDNVCYAGETPGTYKNVSGVGGFKGRTLKAVEKDFYKWHPDTAFAKDYRIICIKKAGPIVS